MKKLLSVLLIFVMIISCANLGIVFAEEKALTTAVSTDDQVANVFDKYNLLPDKDSNFESGTHTWSVVSSGNVQVESNPSGSGKVLSYAGYNTSSTWSSPALNVRNYIKAGITKPCELTVYFEIYSTVAVSCSARIRTNSASDYSKCEEAGQPYCYLGAVDVAANKWTPVEVKMPVTASDLAKTSGEWNLCFDGLVSKLNGAKLYLDNIYVGAVSPLEGEPAEIPAKTPITRSNYTKIGTIRWDAFTKSTPDGTNPSSQVARVLSPKEYHGQAPFFSKVNADGTISFPEYTVETWEAEAKYAHDAGLDYFAYLWYETSADLSQPRKMHLLSENKDLIEMAGILETIRGTATMNEMFEAMKDPVWLRLDNRPVVFLYSLSSENWTAEKVQQLRQMAANAGIKESLYIIGMYTTYTDLDAAYDKDIDALSWYSYGAKMQGWPYSDFVDSLEELMVNMFEASSSKYDHQVVPSFSTGRDSRARIQTGVSWVDGDPNATEDKDKPYLNRYSLLPTMPELKEHIATTYKLVQKYASKSTPNLICSYGWNEHEEGGWLCPTLNCDEDGNVILDENGNYTYNTERLDAFKEVVQELREESHVSAPTPDPNATKTISNGNAESGVENWDTLHAGSLGYIQPGANGTENGIRFIPNESNKYSTVFYNFGAAIMNDAQYNYAGCGAGTYTVTFYAKAEKGKSGIFNINLTSSLHANTSSVRSILGYTEGDGNYASNTYYGVKTITMTDEWQKFTATFDVTDDWLNMIKKLRRSSHAQASKAYDLGLRLDASGEAAAYGNGEFFDYYIDEVTITNKSASYPTPTPIPQIIVTPTPQPTAIPLNKVADYLEYEIEDSKAVITSVDTSIHGEVTIPDKLGGYPVAEIGDNAFEYAVKLTEIKLPNTVTTIGDYAFERCFNLEKINTPTALAYIGRHAFCGCETLKGDIIIPATMININDYAFCDCNNLEAAEYRGTENKFKETVNVGTFNTALTNVLTYNSGDILGAVLNVGSTLTIDYYAKAEIDLAESYMRFTSSSGRVTEVAAVYDEAYKMYKYSYTGINPQCMNDIITAELLYKDDSLLAKHENYSVKLYCERQINRSIDELGFSPVQYEKFKILLADMLEYGAAAQKYKEYRLEALANTSNWVKNYKSTFAVPTGVKEITGNTDAQNRVKSLGVHIANVNNIFFKFTLTDENVKVFINGTEIDRSKLEKNSDGTYTYYTRDLKATEFDKVFIAKLVKDGVTISTVKYNVYSYVETKHNDVESGEITRALYNYGKAAQEYIKAVNDPDDDFDLGEEDDLSTITNVSILSKANSTFEGINSISQTNWSDMDSAKDYLKLSLRKEDGNQFLVASYTDGTQNYHTPMFNLLPFIKVESAYTVTYRFKIKTKGAEVVDKPFSNLIRTQSETSFASAHGSNYYLALSTISEAENDVWYTVSETFNVLASDIGKGGYWNFGFHTVNIDEIAEICIDDFVVKGTVIEKEQPVSVSFAETWRSNEITLISDVKYDDPYRMVNVDLVLTNGTTTYTVPGFWDGGDIWRVRFMCPTAGEWTYTTVCSDTSNAGLHNQKNTLICTEYSGDLELYKRGHVKVEDNVKYFMYDDSTPFFYLADTHWNLGSEPLDIVQTVIDNRVELGYSVIQSEPLGAQFKFTDGVSTADIPDLRVYDQKFQIIADAGLMHVNASFFYPSSMITLINNFGGFSDKVVGTATHPTVKNDDGTYEYQMYDLSDSAKLEIERACRYWVARYSSYPVMWSLGQEVDNDFFWNRDTFNGHKQWSYVNNPYHYVAEYISKYDPYAKPLTAHQEGIANVGASKSSFRDLEEHDFFALQWSPSLTNENNNHTYAKDAWDNGQGKPVVNYEGRYCYLWTKNFGARAQGWIAYLSGVYGYAWGGQDTWSYLNTYDEDTTTKDGVDIITPEEKQAATWEDSLTYPSAIQVGYMRHFFEDTVGDWWNLVPRFNSTTYLERSTGAYANIASNEENDKIVIYFFNFSDTSVAEIPNSTNNGTATGKLKDLDWFTTYKYRWFDPINNTYTAEATMYSMFGSVSLPQKPAGTDYVLYVYK